MDTNKFCNSSRYKVKRLSETVSLHSVNGIMKYLNSRSGAGMHVTAVNSNNNILWNVGVDIDEVTNKNEIRYTGALRYFRNQFL
jgi:hypothetical protein